MPTWRSTLPQRPRPDGFSHQVTGDLIRTEMDAGPDAVRPRSSVPIDQRSCTYELNHFQWAELQAFYLTDCGLGALVFQWPDPLAGLALVNARFLDGPRVTAAGEYHLDAAIRLEVLP